MKIKVLGCSGSEGIGHNTPGFLINDSLMMDAGTITSVLGMRALVKITDILISHPHLDHVKDILFLGDTIVGRVKGPVIIHALPQVISAIRKYLMNGVIWPDFSKIPSSKHPVFRYRPFSAGKSFSINGLSVKPISMNHPVPAVGFLISDSKASILYSADTGPNTRLWKEASCAKDLKAIIVDTSFPDAYSALAGTSGHFTPMQLRNDIERADINGAVPIYIYHIKPAYQTQVLKDLRAMGRDNIKILKEGKTYWF